MSDFIDPGLLLGAIDKWGRASQIEMIQEEAMELALALQQMRRKSKGKREMLERVIDEIADVHIMMAQARILFDPAWIDERIRFKMDRLAQRLEPTNADQP